MIKPDDDDGHVIAAVLAVMADRLGTAHVKDLLTKFGQNKLLPLRYSCTIGQLVLDVSDHFLK